MEGDDVMVTAHDLACRPMVNLDRSTDTSRRPKLAPIDTMKPRSLPVDNLWVAKTGSAGTAPHFSVFHPLPWATHHVIRLSEPLGIDGRYAVGGMVAGEVAGTAVKYGIAVKDFAQISKTTGLRVFAKEVGVKGVLKQAAKSAGKGWAIGWAVTGAIFAGGLAVGYLAHSSQKQGRHG